MFLPRPAATYADDSFVNISAPTHNANFASVDVEHSLKVAGVVMLNKNGIVGLDSAIETYFSENSNTPAVVTRSNLEGRLASLSDMYVPLNQFTMSNIGGTVPSDKFAAATICQTALSNIDLSTLGGRLLTTAYGEQTIPFIALSNVTIETFEGFVTFSNMTSVGMFHLSDQIGALRGEFVAYSNVAALSTTALSNALVIDVQRLDQQYNSLQMSYDILKARLDAALL